MKKRRNYSTRFLLKTIICIIGMVGLFFIAMSYKNYIIKEGKTPYLTMKEILPVVEAFSEKEGLNIYQEVWQEKERRKEEYVTAGEIRLLLSSFPLIEAEVLQEYKKDNWYIGVSDWNRILTELVEDYGGEEIVFTSLALMGTAQEVISESGEELEETEILTQQGMYAAVFWNAESYMYSTVTAVCCEKDILTITGYSKEPHEEDNVYLAGSSDAEYHFFTDGYHVRYPKINEDGASFLLVPKEVLSGGELVNLTFEQGIVKVEKKQVEYINGKLLQISEDGFEIEGHGLFKSSEDMVVYRLYGELASKQKSDLRIGYDFTDFVLEDGKIVASLMMKEADMEYIRVLLKSTDYAGRYHEKFEAWCNQDYEILCFENGVEVDREEKKAGEKFEIEADDIKNENVRIRLEPTVLSAEIKTETIGRSQGNPAYKGTIEITGEEEGLVLVNEVLLEDYLRYVVPSEMPASYPKQALMAQAVCARTYAYGNMIKAGLPALGAHVDDSAAFQVYNNINEQDSTTEAVRSTHNMIAVYQDEPIGTYYYSTSCGVGSDTSVWHGSGESPDYLKAAIIANDKVSDNATGGNMETGENDEGEDKLVVTVSDLSKEDNFREWILHTDAAHFEAQEGWYRWTYDVDEIDVSHVEEVLRSRFASNPSLILTQNKDGEFESREISDLGSIKDIEVIKRLTGGVADELLITGSKSVIKVLSELNIRYILSDGEAKVRRQSGDYVNASSTIPSAFMIIDTKKENGVVTGYSVTGGGFGHGVGMSQNGAKNMANQGMNCEEILGFFYPGSEIKELEFGE